MSCVRASRPVEAVTARGSPKVNSGSTTARRASIPALRRLALTRCAGRSQNGVAGDLASRAGRGGNRDVGHRRLKERLAAAHHLQVVERFAGVAEHGCQGFAGIDGAAATDGNHHVTLFGAREFRAAADQLDGWLAGNREGDRRHSGGGERGSESRRRARGCAGHHQRAPAQGGGGGSHLGERSLAEEDAGGGGEFEARHYQPWSGGSMLV